MKYIKIIALCCIFVFAFASCAQSSDETRNTGILANDEVVSSIRQELADRENSLLANEDDVFWTPSGTIWHSSHTCSYIANSKTIYHGTLEEARLEGKERACDRCAVNSVNNIYLQLEQNEVKQGDVFFTRDGECWHNDMNCEQIKGAQRIYFASKEIAESLGKAYSCDKCDK